MDYLGEEEVDPIARVDTAADDDSLAPDEITKPTQTLPLTEHRELADDASSINPRETTPPTIDNPLIMYSPRQVDEMVSKWARTHNLTDLIPLLQRGAQLARDKTGWMRAHPELPDEDRQVLEAEDKAGFWMQSKFLKATILTLATLSGIIQGWTQSAQNGANAGIPRDFALQVGPNGAGELNGGAGGESWARTRDLWVFGILNASPLLAAGLVGSFFSDPLQEHVLGRRGAVAFSSVMTIAGTVGAAFAGSVPQLVGCRIVSGTALGAKASVVPIYTAEIAPAPIRGELLANWQLADALGIFLGFAANLVVIAFDLKPELTWRIETATVLIPAIPLMLIVFLMPESPRFLMKKGRYRKALESFNYLRLTPLLAARDMMQSHFQLDVEARLMESRLHPTDNNTASDRPQHLNQRMNRRQSSTGSLASTAPAGDVEKSSAESSDRYLYQISEISYWQRYRQVFREPRSRRAAVCAATAMIAQQMTGINTLAFLSTTVLSDANSPPAVTSWLGFGFGLCNYLFGLPAYWLIDRIGRATLLLIGLPNMAWLMLVLAFCFKVDQGSAGRFPLIGIFAFLFTIVYSPTGGTSPFSISAEVFPLVTREAGMALSVAVNLTGTGILVLTFSWLSHAMGGYTASLSLFAALNILAFILVFLFCPETKGRTLEELQYTFDLPTRKHIEYRWGYVRPWVWRKYVRRGKVDDLVPFYRWARE